MKTNKFFMGKNMCYCMNPNMWCCMNKNMDSENYYYEYTDKIIKLFENNSVDELIDYLQKNNLIDKFNNIYFYDTEQNISVFIIEYLLNLCYANNALLQKLFDLIKFLNENGCPIDFNKKLAPENVSNNITYNKDVKHPVFTLFLTFDLNKVKNIVNYILDSNNIKIKETYFECWSPFFNNTNNNIKKGEEFSILDVAIYLHKLDWIKFFMEEKNIKRYNQFSLRYVTNFSGSHIFNYLVDNTDSFDANLLNEKKENLLFEIVKNTQTSYFIEYIEKKIPKEDFEKMILFTRCQGYSFIDYCAAYKNLNTLKYLKEKHFDLFKKLINENSDSLYSIISMGEVFELFKFLILNGIPYNKKELLKRIREEKEFISYYNKFRCIDLDLMKEFLNKYEKLKNQNQ